MFQTSRGPLREALRVLEQKGLLKIKRGVRGGAVVKHPGTAPVSESLGLLIRHRKITLAELAEFREGVEGSVASIAATRATADDIEGMKNLLEKAEKDAAKCVDTWESFCEVDNQIHVAIAKAAGNRVYEFVMKMIHDNIQEYYKLHPLKDKQFMQENHQDLRDIVTALEKKQETAVRALMQSHVRRFNRYMSCQNKPLQAIPYPDKQGGASEHEKISRIRE
jgi:DNA-binding FadR family transcriptional regulator